ncbi:hypothetical protein OFC37_34265, partial [Escherichia coli]|nr:hypothetical protein [Escherichia coli]
FHHAPDMYFSTCSRPAITPIVIPGLTFLKKARAKRYLADIRQAFNFRLLPDSVIIWPPVSVVPAH